MSYPKLCLWTIMIKVYIKMVSYIQLSLQMKIIIIQICIERFLMYDNY